MNFKIVNNRYLITVIALCSAIFLVVFFSMLSGPRIRSSNIDTNLAVKQPFQALSIETNMQLRSISLEDVRIVPEVKYRILNQGSTLYIEFGERLQYGQTYEVVISKLEAKNGNKKTLNNRIVFYTPKPQYMALIKKDAIQNKDTIVTFSKDQTDKKLVYDADSIVDFKPLRNGIVVVENVGLAEDRVSIVEDGGLKEVKLPKNGRVSNLRVAPDGSSFGIIFTSKKEYINNETPTYENSLLVYSSTNYIPREIKGISGYSISVLDWYYSPDAVTLAVLTYNSDVLLLSNDEVVALGRYTSIEGFSYDGTSLLASEPLDMYEIELSTKDRTLVASYSDNTNITDQIFAKNSDSKIVIKEQLNTETNSYEKIIFFKSEVEKEIFRSNYKNTVVDSLFLSENDQYLLLSMYDVPLNSDDKKMYTLVIDLSNPKNVGKFETPHLEIIN